MSALISIITMARAMALLPMQQVSHDALTTFPRGHSIYRDLGTLSSRGFFDDLQSLKTLFARLAGGQRAPAEFHGAQTLTRYEVAVYLDRAITRGSGTSRRLARLDDLHVRSLPDLYAALYRVLTELRAEIKVLGVDPQPLIEEVESRRGIPEPFADVPKSHWAYSAVEFLRGKGILVGYPDRQFKRKISANGSR